MSLDPYSPCPCGSGNKLKFCCHAIVSEMTKVERMIRGSQNLLALQTLEALSELHPGNPWIGIHRAAILLGESKPDAAVEVLQPVVEHHPDHLHAIAVLANAAFAADGFELAKPFIHRAFQRCEVEFPGMIGNLALGIAAAMFSQRKYMAARQHLTLAMRLVSDEHKQGVFVRLIEFDGNRMLPFPQRSVHELAEVTGDDAFNAEAKKARRLSDAGCWRPAAKIFNKLAEEHPDRADLWHNTALCRVWDGDEVAAAAAFHKAAELTDDFEQAVELETLAQLLDYNTTEDTVVFKTQEYRVESVAQLLSNLQGNRRMIRLETDTDEEADSQLAAEFHLLDRDESTGPIDESTDLNDIATVLADVLFYNSHPDVPDSHPMAILSARVGEKLDAAKRTFAECCGDLVTPVELDETEQLPVQSVPRELYELSWRWQYPDGTSQRVKRQLELRMWEQKTLRQWFESPLASLGGMSPRDAAQDAGKRIALSAAVIVLDSFCDRADHNLQIDRLREQLSLETPQTIENTPDKSLNTFTVMQLQRLPVEELTDGQLSSTLNRAILVHHGRFLKRVLIEALKRPACVEHVDINQVYSTLCDLCIEHGELEEAIDWCQRGAEEAKTQDKAFEKTLQWAIRELSLRLFEPESPEIAPLLERIDQYFLVKIPEMRPAIEQMLSAHGVAIPWAGRVAGGDLATAGAAADGGALWTPDSAKDPAGEGKKIWIPGQD